MWRGWGWGGVGHGPRNVHVVRTVGVSYDCEMLKCPPPLVTPGPAAGATHGQCPGIHQRAATVPQPLFRPRVRSCLIVDQSGRNIRSRRRNSTPALPSQRWCTS